MSNTLAYGATTLTLPDDILWPDEFVWKAVEQTTEYSIAGALLVQSAAKQAGRPCTLQGGDDYAWMPRETLLTLRAWAALPGQTFALSYRGTAYMVIFDQETGPIDAHPVFDFRDPDDQDHYVVTLRFLVV